MDGPFEVEEQSTREPVSSVDGVWCRGCETLLLRGRVAHHSWGERIICMECGLGNAPAAEPAYAAVTVRQKDALLGWASRRD